jgi:hypothetical protein
LKRHQHLIPRLPFIIMTLFFILLCNIETPAQGLFQRNDPDYEHSATRATLMSAALPGLGQAYNKKYWKIPIIYAGFGTLYYFIRFNGTEYRKFRDAYNVVALGDSANFVNHEYVIRYNANINQLQQGRNYYRRNLELNYIMAGALYILQIIDASVDANLYDFDVSDELTFRLEPVTMPNMYALRPTPGFTLRYRF